MIPYREFDGEPGDYSVDTQGPVYIQKDFDKLFHMFNPEAEFDDGTPGGITSENFAHSAAEDYDFLEHIGAKLRGEGHTAQEVIDLIAGEIGVLDNLTTTQKDSLVDAINELDSNIGDLSDLPATDQSSIVAAINDIYDNKIEPAFDNARDALAFIGTLTSLYTTAKSNLVDAINEIYTRQVADRMDISYLEGAVGDLTTLSTTDKTSLVGAINELASSGSGTESVIGLLTDLETTDKSNIVAAINEVNSGVNDQEVGGRNIVRNTRDYNGWITTGDVDLEEGEPTGTIVFNADSGTRSAASAIGVPFSLIRKQKISISMMVHMESTFSTRNISVTLILSSTPDGSQESVAVMQKSFVPDGGWQRITLEWELKDSSFLGTADLDNCYVRPKISTNSNADIMVKEIIIETGKISAAWTPAPEDLIETVGSMEESIETAMDAVETITEKGVLSDNIFWVVFPTNNSCEQTFADIYSAYGNNKILVATDMYGTIGVLTEITSSSATFTFTVAGVADRFLQFDPSTITIASDDTVSTSSGSTYSIGTAFVSESADTNNPGYSKLRITGTQDDLDYETAEYIFGSGDVYIYRADRGVGFEQVTGVFSSTVDGRYYLETPTTKYSAASKNAALLRKTTKVAEEMVSCLGNYEGSGQSGSSHPNSITFPDYFYPYMIVVGSAYTADDFKTFYIIPSSDDYTLAYVKGDGTFTINRVTDNSGNVKTVTLQWYNSSSTSQMNDSQTTYRWYAVGKKVG